jgi:PAS domain S-box-containing protein
MISVLYVDDESTLLEITRIWLEQTGEFLVSTCASADDALRILGSRPFDAIVSDYQMPVMDGIAFLRHLRTAKNPVPFILFTGKGREEVAIAALNSGADFYLQKGGEPKSQFAELASKIRQAVQRRQAEQALAASEEKYRELVENINDVIYTLSPEGIISYMSPVVSVLGYEQGDLIGRPIDAFIPADDLPLVRERLAEIGRGDLHPVGFRIRDASGAIRHVRTSSRPVMANGRFAGVHGVMTDITSQRDAEEKLSVSEQRYCNVFEAAGDALLVVDQDAGRILDANRSASALFGFTATELRTMRPEDLLAGGDTGTPGSDMAGIFGSRFRFFRRKDTSTFPASLLISEYPQEARTVSIHSIRDLTDEARAEERVLAAQRLYAVLSQVNQAIVRVSDLPELLRRISEISVTLGRFRMAWVGLIDRESQAIRPVASAGDEEGYLAATEESGDEEERRQSPIGVAIHDGVPGICNDIETDPVMAPWRNEALLRSYRSMAAVPISSMERLSASGRSMPEREISSTLRRSHFLTRLHPTSRLLWTGLTNRRAAPGPSRPLPQAT